MCITDIQESELGKAYSNGTRFDLITESGAHNNIAVLDTEGNVWVLYGNIGHNGISAGYSGVYCINNVEGHKINEQAQKYEDYKIEKINSIYGIGLAITDNQGTTWLISNDTAKIQDKYNVPTDITDIALEYLIDGYGQIWKWSSTGSECLAGTIKNELY